MKNKIALLNHANVGDCEEHFITIHEAYQLFNEVKGKKSTRTLVWRKMTELE